jgi:two-component system sensor histidine kinase VicK
LLEYLPLIRKPLKKNTVLFINDKFTGTLHLIMAENFFEAIAEQSPNANFVFDLEIMQFVYVNEAFKNLTGIDGKASIKSILNIVHSEDREHLKTNFYQLLEGNNNKTIDFRLQRSNQWIRLTPFLFSSASGKAIISSAADITADVNNLETFKKYANKKNSILTILSHDLRGPLGMANIVTQLLNNKLEDPNLIHLVKTVSKILSQSIDLIADLTGREFLETTGVDILKQRINIALKLKQYMEEAQKSATLTGRSFRFTTSNEDIFLYLDEGKFMQVINNLMTNALKFTNDETGVISLRVQEKEETVLFTFSDNGIGIPERFHSTLFDKFTDARRTGLKGEPTIGLGLSIVKLIISWHHGTIWFESEEGHGTTFYFEVPKAETAA